MNETLNLHRQRTKWTADIERDNSSLSACINLDHIKNAKLASLLIFAGIGFLSTSICQKSSTLHGNLVIRTI